MMTTPMPDIRIQDDADVCKCQDCQNRFAPMPLTVPTLAAFDDKNGLNLAVKAQRFAHPHPAAHGFRQDDMLTGKPNCARAIISAECHAAAPLFEFRKTDPLCRLPTGL